MMLRRWEPLNGIERMNRDLDRMWRGFGAHFEHPEMENWAIPLDVIRENDNIIVRASVPGVNPDDIDVAIENNVLTIKGETKEEHEEKEEKYLMRERRVGSFYRALRLPDSVDTDKAEPHYHDGVLTVTFPKLESKKAKRLKVAEVKELEGEVK